MPNLKMIVLIGQYAQHYYLGDKMDKNLTETVRAFETYLPQYFPLPHPSPINIRWRRKNPWFESDIVPVLQNVVASIIA